MPYSALPTLDNGNPFSLSVYDAIKENFAVGVPDIFAAKGDLAVGLTTDSAARLAVGANGAILVPDSSQSTGLAWQIQPAARVRRTTDQVVSAGVWTAILFDSERYDTDAAHSTATNTSRFTIPTGGAGIYKIGCCAALDYSGGGELGLRCLLNGTTVIARAMVKTFSGVPADYDTLIAETDWALGVGDFVEWQVMNHTGAVTVKVVDACSPEAWIAWQRRQ